MKKKYTFTLEDNDDFFIIKPVKDQILDNVPKGKTTMAKIVGEQLGITRRNALVHLTELEDKGLFKSEEKLIKLSKTGARTTGRVFERL